MLILLTFIVSGLFWYTIVLPCHDGQKIRVARRSDEYYRLIKLSAVRDYYPEFNDLSLREIALRYDYDEAYRRIGK